MGLMNLLRGVGDQLDFVPGFDPIKDKQGLLSQILSPRAPQGSNPARSAAGPMMATPHSQPRAVPAPTMTGGMGRPLPGGAAMMPKQAASTATPTYKSSVNPFEEWLLPSSFTDDRKANDTAKYNAEVAKYEAQQAAQANEQARVARFAELDSMNKTLPPEKQISMAEMALASSNEKAMEALIARQFKAPSPFESKTDAFGRPMAFDPNTGGYGDAVGNAKPMDFGGMAVDPVTMGTLGDFRTPAQSGEMTDYERNQIELKRQEMEQGGGAGAPDLNTVKGIRETNEKRLQVFQESQRQFQTMGKLAEDATGASDVALGFAFFKTIDPTSTVREGEFAQAASSMGLGARTIAALEKLDSGQKFSPQLRKELLAAAGHAYDLQKRDIEGMVERETAFAQRYGMNPEDIVRNPVVDMPAPPPRVPLVSGMLNTIRGPGQPSTDLPPGFIEID